MRLLGVLPQLLSRAHISLPAPRPIPRGTSIRLLSRTDRAACWKMYRENQKHGFPKTCDGFFEQFLERTDCVKLALCLQGTAVAVGGLRITSLTWPHRAWLVFGMVTPSLHRHGLGTALLLARLGTIPRPTTPLRIAMTNVGGSARYYARFGFSYWNHLWVGNPRIQLHCSSALLAGCVWDDARMRLAELGLSLPEIAIPNGDIGRPRGRVASRPVAESSQLL